MKINHGIPSKFYPDGSLDIAFEIIGKTKRKINCEKCDESLYGGQIIRLVTGGGNYYGNSYSTYTNYHVGCFLKAINNTARYIRCRI